MDELVRSLGRITKHLPNTTPWVTPSTVSRSTGEPLPEPFLQSPHSRVRLDSLVEETGFKPSVPLA